MCHLSPQAIIGVSGLSDGAMPASAISAGLTAGAHAFTIIDEVWCAAAPPSGWWRAGSPGCVCLRATQRRRCAM